MRRLFFEFLSFLLASIPCAVHPHMAYTRTLRYRFKFESDLMSMQSIVCLKGNS